MSTGTRPSIGGSIDSASTPVIEASSAAPVSRLQVTSYSPDSAPGGKLMVNSRVYQCTPASTSTETAWVASLATTPPSPRIEKNKKNHTAPSLSTSLTPPIVF